MPPKTSNLTSKFALADVAESTGYEEADKLLGEIRRQEFSFEIRGVNSQFANCLISILYSQLPEKRLYFDLEDFACDEKTIYYDIIRLYINQIPVLQSVPDNAIFELAAKNTGLDRLNLTSGHIVQKDGKKGKWFDAVHILDSVISPGKSIHIKKIYIKKATAAQHGNHTIVIGPVALPLGVEMYNQYEKRGESSLNTNPADFQIKFSTNGVESPYVLMQMACQVFIDNLDRAADIDLDKTENGFVLKIDGEYEIFATTLARYFAESKNDEINLLVKECDRINKFVLLEFQTKIQDQKKIKNAFAAVVERLKDLLLKLKDEFIQ